MIFAVVSSSFSEYMSLISILTFFIMYNQEIDYYFYVIVNFLNVQIIKIINVK